MNFKYYDTLSMLVSGVVLLFVLSITTEWDILEINTIVLLALAYILGYMLNAVSAIMEPIYFWFMGGFPSDKLLKKPTPGRRGKSRNYTGFGRIRFYEYEKIVKLLRQELNDEKANEGMMFSKAMSYSNSDDKTRVPDFNAQYAFSRVMLTLVIFSSAVLMPKYFDIWWAWCVAVAVVFLIGHRCKERSYYYAKEVLVEYIKAKEKTE